MKTYNKGFQIKGYRKNTYENRRTLPVSVQLKIWFGNIFCSMGLIFFLFGLPFAFVFISFSSLFEPGINNEDPYAKGRIVNYSSTNASINDVTVYEYTYRFYTSKGEVVTDVGYTTGKLFSNDESIRVQYKKDNPEISRAEGMRASEFGGPVALFVLIFPGIGMVFMIIGTRKTINSIRVLKVGQLAEGRYLSQEATNMKVNNQTVYKLFFEFMAKDGRKYNAVAKTHKTNRLLDEEFEKLVYDPNEPSNAVLLDALPKGVKKYFLNSLS